MKSNNLYIEVLSWDKILEDSKMRNKIIYERFGFETYHYYENKKEELQYWFMKWQPENEH